MKKNFFVDDVEQLARCWWFAEKVTDRAHQLYDPYTYLIPSAPEMVRETVYKTLFEIDGYIMGYTLDRLRDEITASHGWEKGNALFQGYMFSFRFAFDEVFGIDNKKSPGLSFGKVIGHYVSVGEWINTGQEKFLFASGYDKFWNIEDFEYSPNWNAKKADARWRKKMYNYERLYVYRMSEKFRLGDKEKVISRVLECRHVGDEFYDKAFFDLRFGSWKVS